MDSILISACLLGVPCRYDGKSKPVFGTDTISKLRARYNLVPVCPEIYGGLPTPRTGSERVGEMVVMRDGTDVTENFRRGAVAALELAHLFGCKTAILKERSPSCGKERIYDGSFSGTLTDGDGVTAELLRNEGITVLGESEVEKIL